MQHVFACATLIIIKVTLNHIFFFSKLIKYLPPREIFNIRVVDLNNYIFTKHINSQKTNYLLEIRVKMYSLPFLQHRIYCGRKKKQYEAFCIEVFSVEIRYTI